MSADDRVSSASIFAIERPSSALFTYYVVSSLLLGPLFFVALVPLYFRFHTLRYRFDQEGISMRWGILFRREINLTYARIQDIHLRSNVVERWLGLARIEVQTASGTSAAEMTLEGLREFEAIRDHLYARMRGVRDRRLSPVQVPTAAAPSAVDASVSRELVATLREVAAEVRALRETISARDRGIGDA